VFVAGRQRGGNFLKSGKNRFLYVLFFLLFAPDTWRILIGLLATLVIAPRVTAGGDYTAAGQAVIWLMILVIFYVLSAPAGKFISKRLTSLIRKTDKL
jgi:hypothetical protein